MIKSGQHPHKWGGGGFRKQIAVLINLPKRASECPRRQAPAGKAGMQTRCVSGRAQEAGASTFGSWDMSLSRQPSWGIYCFTPRTEADTVQGKMAAVNLYTVLSLASTPADGHLLNGPQEYMSTSTWGEILHTFLTLNKVPYGIWIHISVNESYMHSLSINNHSKWPKRLVHSMLKLRLVCYIHTHMAGHYYRWHRQPPRAPSSEGAPPCQPVSLWLRWGWCLPRVTHQLVVINPVLDTPPLPPPEWFNSISTLIRLLWYLLMNVAGWKWNEEWFWGAPGTGLGTTKLASVLHIRRPIQNIPWFKNKQFEFVEHNNLISCWQLYANLVQ